MTSRQAKIEAIQFLVKMANQSADTHADKKKQQAYWDMAAELSRKAANLQKSENRAKDKKAGLIPKSSLRQS